MGEVVSGFAQHLNKPVLDKTGLLGEFSFNFIYPPGGSGSPAYFDAVQDQLGLKLEPIKASMEMLVIDHVEKPSAN